MQDTSVPGSLGGGSNETRQDTFVPESSRLAEKRL
jgi:hypothetical protein